MTKNIINFINRFPDETSCVEFIRQQWDRQGISCKRCSGTQHYWLENKHAFQCSSCGFRTSIKSGTVMESSNLPVRVWMMAITFISATKKGFSAAKLQTQLGMKRYESGKLDKSCRYFKMKKTKNLEAKTAQALIKEYIDSNSVLQTDQSTTFSDLGDCVDVHVREISGTEEGKFNLRWVHIVISNLKKHRQTYL